MAYPELQIVTEGNLSCSLDGVTVEIAYKTMES